MAEEGPKPDAKNQQSTFGNSSGIWLSAPWSNGASNLVNYIGQPVDDVSLAVAQQFVRERTEVHRSYIEQTEKTKRFGYGLAAGLLAIACIVPVITPPEREDTSWITSAALFVFAAGSMGYTTIWLRMKKREMKLSRGD